MVRLTNRADLAEARHGKRTNLVALPSLGSDSFADLDGLTTVAKTALVSLERVSGVSTDTEVREFSFAVSRRFGRFAYPDEIVKCLAPVRNAILERAHKPNSPLGKAVAHVHSFRIQCEDWSTVPHELTLIVVMEAGILPSDLDSLNRPSDLDSNTSARQARAIKDRINDCLADLDRTSLNDAARYFAWQQLSELWAQQCEEAATELNYQNTVRSVTAEVVSVDDFPMSRFLATESLDLDHLSDSRGPAL
ncbi:hypothetical protein AB0F44_29165 [Nocardioides sp. NPDC023903]|uniref:hypothetical protein n=1 Tax=Nocardioides sp. NPDC023903 TaxID=3157195 RepID=UPI0033D01628